MRRSSESDSGSNSESPNSRSSDNDSEGNNLTYPLIEGKCSTTSSCKRTLKRKHSDMSESGSKNQLMTFEEIMISEQGGNAYTGRLKWLIKQQMLKANDKIDDLAAAKKRLTRYIYKVTFNIINVCL